MAAIRGRSRRPRGAYCVVGHGATVDSPVVRIVVARCQVDYAGRLSAHLPLATRVLMLKSDGSVLIHSDGGSYKPLNWMSPPCTVREGVAEDGRPEWLVTAGKSDDTLRILIDEVLHDTSHDLGIDPGLQKDGVEKHLQELLAEHPATLADGLTLVRREFMTAIGPVDLMCRDADGLSVAVEIKRRGEIDGVEQLTRYLELLNRDPMLTAKGPVRGHLRRPGDQAPGPRARHRPRHRLRPRRLRRAARDGRRRRAPVVLVSARALPHDLDQQVRVAAGVVDGPVGVLDVAEPRRSAGRAPRRWPSRRR